MSTDEFVPYIPAERKIAEVTAQSVILGILLALVMTAANCYLGLKVGMTVSASIPAAVISMAILKGILRRGTILENNIVQTITSTGESLAAGIIFTVPALVITGVWEDFRFWETTAIALLGGLLGVLFMIPLRRALIVKEKQLAFPEGVACAEVLKAGEAGGLGIVYIFIGILAGAGFKLLANLFGYIKGAFETAWSGAGTTVYYFGTEISPLLMSVGYIVGLNVASLVFLGGVIGWVIALPIISSAQAAGDAEIMDIAWEVWDTKIRYLGVGAMVIGGLWTIISIRTAISDSINATISSIGNGAAKEIKRTEQDLGIGFIWKSALIIFIATAILYIFFTKSAALGIFSAVIMVITAFFFVAVASYIVGLVGSSNSPVSGMTICTLLFASFLLIIAGMEGDAGILAALGIAGVVCCAACTAGDISQDLKTGYILGATPRLQQLTQFLGVIFPAFIIAPILYLLSNTYGFERTTEGVEYLTAPQANLFASLTRMIFDRQDLPWDMLIAGAIIGIVLIILDEILKMSKAPVRTYVMAVAVGIYLPLMMSVPIFLGGLIHLLVWRSKVGQGYRTVFESIQRGVLVASGLIAGEALVGIGLAIPLILGATLPLTTFEMTDAAMWWLTVIIGAAVIFGFMAICVAGRQREE
jgi:putative OPT family oligopeptide transporter